MTSALGLSSAKITNLYLWGEEKRPADLLNSSVIRPNDAIGETSVNATAYMTTGPGKYASAADFDIVNYFFASDPVVIRAWFEAQHGLQPDEDAVLTEAMVRQFGRNGVRVHFMTRDAHIIRGGAWRDLAATFCLTSRCT